MTDWVRAPTASSFAFLVGHRVSHSQATQRLQNIPGCGVQLRVTVPVSSCATHSDCRTPRAKRSACRGRRSASYAKLSVVVVVESLKCVAVLRVMRHAARHSRRKKRIGCISLASRALVELAVGTGNVLAVGPWCWH